MTDYAMFLAANAASNLDTALSRGMWGWTDIVLDSPGQIHSGVSGRERVAAMRAGDRLVIATGQRGASVTRRYDPNRAVVLDRLVECRVTAPLFVDHAAVWEPAPDSYRNRVRFEVLAERNGVSSSQLGEDLMVALTDSLNRSGTPFPFAGSHESGEAEVFVLPPPRLPAPPPSETRALATLDRDYHLEAVRQHEIGLQGELLVVEIERERLRAAGRADLGESVEHVALTRGDGLGYDVLSFDEGTGTELHIEVKSTVGPVTTPFPISAGEVRYSSEAGTRYRLYRVFDLEKSPRIYVMHGPLDEHFTLVPTEFLARR